MMAFSAARFLWCRLNRDIHDLICWREGICSASNSLFSRSFWSFFNISLGEYFLLFSILPAKNMLLIVQLRLNQTSYHPYSHTFGYSSKQNQVLIFHPTSFSYYHLITKNYFLNQNYQIGLIVSLFLIYFQLNLGFSFEA